MPAGIIARLAAQGASTAGKSSAQASASAAQASSSAGQAASQAAKAGPRGGNPAAPHGGLGGASPMDMISAGAGVAGAAGGLVPLFDKGEKAPEKPNSVPVDFDV